MTDNGIDRSALCRLLEMIGGDPEDLADLLEEYLDTAPDLAAQIRSAAATGDYDSLRIAAHTLKSNARDFGATRLSALCAELEHDCRDGDVVDPERKAAAIAAEEDAARGALSALYVRSLGS